MFSVEMNVKSHSQSDVVHQDSVLNLVDELPTSATVITLPVIREPIATNSMEAKTEDSLRVQLGEVLLEKGWITTSQLHSALQLQLESGLQLGDHLVSEGSLTQDQLKQALAEQEAQNRDLANLFRRAGLMPLQIRQLQMRLERNEELVDIVSDLGYATDDVVVRVQAAYFNQEPLTSDMASELDLSDYVALGLPFPNPKPFVPVGYNPATHKLSVAISRIDQRNDAENYFYDLFRTRNLQVHIHFKFASATTVQGVFFRWFSNTEQALLQRIRECDETNAKTDLASDDEANVALASNRGLIFDILRHACYCGASDIHLEQTSKVGYILYRFDGVRQRFAPMSLKTYGMLNNLLRNMVGVTNQDLQKELMVEGSFKTGEGWEVEKEVEDMFLRWNFRLEFGEAISGSTVVIRVNDSQSSATDWEKLNFKPNDKKFLEDILSTSAGLIIITGPTGSGKTTTLYAALRRIDADARSLQTIERPVEFRDPRWKQYQVPNSIDEATGSKILLKGMLRNDPDVILQGEARDAEACDLMLRASNTGHLCFVTFHTNRSPTAISQFRRFNLPAEMVASELSAILGQRLVRRLCTNCRQPDTRPETKEALVKSNIQTTNGIQYRANPDGCHLCNHTGYRGRRMVYELLRVTSDIRRMIERNAPISEIDDKAFATEHRMWRHGLEMVADGVTSIEEIRENVPRED
ncbi:Flp pilus assembly complex ATPase component TadA [Chromobacterium haemolyticum]|uniref:Flp pilus assembly complex ATPase component TadA n=1 Tax=Chromobacterium fluminis TaxID=3044269 RepID=A0ABX0L8A1_9NEIS|nr:ATPase, T2SS/T4P/T4SS family [Chromobacterium haemolyticum]NHR04545.1 Flp pilus assembly complex ATPase component TadA [Chromobacterium haemolyticum]